MNGKICSTTKHLKMKTCWSMMNQKKIMSFLKKQIQLKRFVSNYWWKKAHENKCNIFRASFSCVVARYIASSLNEIESRFNKVIQMILCIIILTNRDNKSNSFEFRTSNIYIEQCGNGGKWTVLNSIVA